MATGTPGGISVPGAQAIFNVATRTRRTGIHLGATARDSRDTSLVSTATAIRWINKSNEVPLQVRFKAVNAMRIFSDFGTEGSNATSRLLQSGQPGTTTYTSVAAATWSDWENVWANYNSKSEDGVQSHVLCYVAGTGVLSYEVQTVPKAKPNG